MSRRITAGYDVHDVDLRAIPSDVLYFARRICFINQFKLQKLYIATDNDSGGNRPYQYNLLYWASCLLLHTVDRYHRPPFQFAVVQHIEPAPVELVSVDESVTILIIVARVCGIGENYNIICCLRGATIVITDGDGPVLAVANPQDQGWNAFTDVVAQPA